MSAQVTSATGNYTWDIPSDFNINSGSPLNISISDADIANDQILEVTVASQNGFKLISENDQEITYALYETGNQSPLASNASVLKYQPGKTNKVSNSLSAQTVSMPDNLYSGSFKDTLVFTSGVNSDPDYAYSITYNLNGGTLSGDYPTSYTSSAGLSTLPTPARDGYVFAGWQEEVNYSIVTDTDSNGIVSKSDIISLNGIDLGSTSPAGGSDSTTDTFRVLSVEGNQVKLLAMDNYKTAYFSYRNNTYDGSVLDTEMTNYFNALPANVQSVIVEQNISQSKYSWSSGTNSSASFSSWYKFSFTESDVSGTNYYLTRTTEANVGNRKIYALDVDDVIAYLGSNSTAKDVNELFFNQRSYVSPDVWLRSADADDASRAFLVRGDRGDVYDRDVSDDFYVVRPAFVINVSSEVTSIPSGTTGDKTLTAKWQKNIISFQIRHGRATSVTFQSEEGMTWEEWCNSEYNTSGYYVSNGRVYNADSKYESIFYSTEIIHKNQLYNFERYVGVITV